MAEDVAADRGLTVFKALLMFLLPQLGHTVETGLVFFGTLTRLLVES